MGVVVASALDFRPEGSFMLFPLTKKLHSTLSLSTQVYKRYR